MSVFVYDYDHNTPSVEHLIASHEKLFKKVRERNPELPIVIMSMPRNKATDVIKLRRDIIKKTYENAVAAGDENVYFIDGETFFDIPDRDMCTADTCHPNDLGYHFMANAFGEIIGELLEKK